MTDLNVQVWIFGTRGPSTGCFISVYVCVFLQELAALFKTLIT